MPLQHPKWWSRAEPDIHASVRDFAGWMRGRVAAIKLHQLIVKNPFLFRARAPENESQLSVWLINAYLSSSEETRFGDILEQTAIAICREARGGWKSSADGIDLEYEKGGPIPARHIVQIKSGTNWGNSSQHKKLVSDFQSASRTIRQGAGKPHVVCVEGICYGPSGYTDRGSHIRLVGNSFWYEISGWVDTGRAVLRVVGKHASNDLADVINVAHDKVVSYLRRSGVARNGDVNWERLYDLVMMPTKERPR